MSDISITENENTDEIVLNVANEAEVNIQLSDIDRSYSGRTNQGVENVQF